MFHVEHDRGEWHLMFHVEQRGPYSMFHVEQQRI